MTKKEFFIQKIIPQIEEQIWTYEYHLIRSQYVLEQLQRELAMLESTQIFRPEDLSENTLKEREVQRENLEKEIEEAQRNIALLPLLKAGEEKFLEYFKGIVEKL